MSYEEQHETFEIMRADPPGVKIVFVTPEKVAQSDKLMRLFDNLHERGLLVGLSPSFATWFCAVICQSHRFSDVSKDCEYFVLCPLT
jgi:hypothetical protein